MGVIAVGHFGQGTQVLVDGRGLIGPEDKSQDHGDPEGNGLSGGDSFHGFAFWSG
jgi:hypothetical protein